MEQWIDEDADRPEQRDDAERDRRVALLGLHHRVRRDHGRGATDRPAHAQQEPELSSTPKRRASHQPNQSAAKVETVTTTSAGAPILHSSIKLKRNPRPATAQRSTGRCAKRMPAAALAGTGASDFHAMPSRMTIRSAFQWSTSAHERRVGEQERGAAEERGQHQSGEQAGVELQAV